MRSQSPKRNVTVLSPLFFLTFVACGDAGSDGPTIEFDNFDGGVVGCSQPSFPSDQPDLSPLAPPIFLLDSRTEQSSVGQAQALPGDLFEAEIVVNEATRRVQIELTNAWSPDNVIFTDQIETTGAETMSVTMVSEEGTRGRYYMRLTLCGEDCDERAIRFAVRDCSDDPSDTEPCGINGTYERSVIERGLVVQADRTCVELGSEPGVGSGTIMIQNQIF